MIRCSFYFRPTIIRSAFLFHISLRNEQVLYIYIQEPSVFFLQAVTPRDYTTQILNRRRNFSGGKPPGELSQGCFTPGELSQGCFTPGELSQGCLPPGLEGCDVPGGWGILSVMSPPLPGRVVVHHQFEPHIIQL